MTGQPLNIFRSKYAKAIQDGDHNEAKRLNELIKQLGG
jgi:hypothetical protein